MVIAEGLRGRIGNSNGGSRDQQCRSCAHGVSTDAKFLPVYFSLDRGNLMLDCFQRGDDEANVAGPLSLQFKSLCRIFHSAQSDLPHSRIIASPVSRKDHDIPGIGPAAPEIFVSLIRSAVTVRK